MDSYDIMETNITLINWNTSSMIVNIFVSLHSIGFLLVATNYCYLRWTRGYRIDRDCWKMRNKYAYKLLLLYNAILLGMEVAFFYLSFLVSLDLTV